MQAWIDGCMLDQYMHISNKQFPSRAPWLTLASRRQCEAHEALSSSAKWDRAAPPTFKWDFRENQDPTKFKQKVAFSQKMYFTTSAIYLMSFGSLGFGRSPFGCQLKVSAPFWVRFKGEIGLEPCLAVLPKVDVRTQAPTGADWVGCSLSILNMLRSSWGGNG